MFFAFALHLCVSADEGCQIQDAFDSCTYPHPQREPATPLGSDVFLRVRTVGTNGGTTRCGSPSNEDGGAGEPASAEALVYKTWLHDGLSAPSRLLISDFCWRKHNSSSRRQPQVWRWYCATSMAWSRSYGSKVSCSRGRNISPWSFFTSEANTASAGAVESMHDALMEITT